MKKSKLGNRFDALVEAMAANFAQIQNFDLMRSDATGKKVFSLMMSRLADLTTYRDLVGRQFIPAANKVVAETRQAMLSSKFRSQIDFRSIDLSETVYDTIRLSYVGLSHKLESQINEMGMMADILFEVGGDESIFTWSKRSLSVDLKDWQRFHPFFRINWIGNCVKHKDGYPLKSPKPAEFADLDPAQRLRLSAAAFKDDCDDAIALYPALMQLVFAFAMTRRGLTTSQSFDHGGNLEMPRVHSDANTKMFELLRQMVEKVGRAHMVE